MQEPRQGSSSRQSGGQQVGLVGQGAGCQVHGFARGLSLKKVMPRGVPAASVLLDTIGRIRRLSYQRKRATSWPLRVVGIAPPVWMLVMLVLIHPKPEIAAPAAFRDCVAAELALVGTER